MKKRKILGLILSLSMILSMVTNVVTAENGEIYNTISNGVASATEYLQAQLAEAHENEGVTYGYEWHIISLLRAGKSIDESILQEYYQSAVTTILQWTVNTKPTDIERTALALAVMDKDITDIEGKNLAELIYNNEQLTNGSNEVAYALLALDAQGIEIPETAQWTREEMVDQLLLYQLEDGSFGLFDTESGDMDITAICIQALAPYESSEAVQQAVEKAVDFLKESISSEYNYSDNPNTTAQVLTALAVLGVDVTDSLAGFGDTDLNIVTALDAYRSQTGGYIYEDSVNAMATIQILQAYDAYRKAHKEGIRYWDFASEGAIYEDGEDQDQEEEPETEKAEPAVVMVTIASEGTVVVDKNGKHVAQSSVVVEDLDEDGKLTVNEALHAAHQMYFEGGAQAGYSTFMSTYGPAIDVLWGMGTKGETLSTGYWLNNVSCWSLNDEVCGGDYLKAFLYYDTVSWGDAYSYFTQRQITVEAGKTAKLSLKYLSGYDAQNDYAPIFSECADANVVVLEREDMEPLITDEDGTVSVVLNDEGDYMLMAYKNDYSIVPSVCAITVTPSRPVSVGGGGGGGPTYYNVKFDTNGGDDPDTQRIVRNGSVTKPEDPTKEGYVFDGWYTEATYETPYDFESKVKGNITIYAKWTEKLEERIVFEEDTFGDVQAEDWYYDSVKYVYEHNLMEGTLNGFEPESSMTRAMLVTVLYRAEKAQTVYTDNVFDDVSDSDWFADSVAWAAENKIVSGVGEGIFAPNENISREQLAAIMYRYANYKGYDTNVGTDLSQYEDYQDISSWSVDAVNWANETNLIQGTSSVTISPKDTATRAQVATILMRFYESKVDSLNFSKG